MRRVVIIFTLVAIAQFAMAQKEESLGLGVRFGYDPGITLKTNVGGATALEGILSPSPHGFLFTGLIEFHKGFQDANGLRYFYGFGGHLGFWNNTKVHPNWVTYEDDEMALGVDGIVGLEYNLQDYPINFTLDWKPAFNLIERPGFMYAGFAFSARYLF